MLCHSGSPKPWSPNRPTQNVTGFLTGRRGLHLIVPTRLNSEIITIGHQCLKFYTLTTTATTLPRRAVLAKRCSSARKRKPTPPWRWNGNHQDERTVPPQTVCRAAQHAGGHHHRHRQQNGWRAASTLPTSHIHITPRTIAAVSAFASGSIPFSILLSVRPSAGETRALKSIVVCYVELPARQPVR